MKKDKFAEIKEIASIRSNLQSKLDNFEQEFNVIECKLINCDEDIEEKISELFIELVSGTQPTIKGYSITFPKTDDLVKFEKILDGIDDNSIALRGYFLELHNCTIQTQPMNKDIIINLLKLKIKQSVKSEDSIKKEITAKNKAKLALDKEIEELKAKLPKKKKVSKKI